MCTVHQLKWLEMTGTYPTYLDLDSTPPNNWAQLLSTKKNLQLELFNAEICIYSLVQIEPCLNFTTYIFKIKYLIVWIYEVCKKTLT